MQVNLEVLKPYRNRSRIYEPGDILTVEEDTAQRLFEAKPGVFAVLGPVEAIPDEDEADGPVGENATQGVASTELVLRPAITGPLDEVDVEQVAKRAAEMLADSGELPY